VHCGIVSAKSTPDTNAEQPPDRLRRRNAPPSARCDASGTFRKRYANEASSVARVPSRGYPLTLKLECRVIPLKRERSRSHANLAKRDISRGADRASGNARKKGPPLQMGAAIALNVEINSYPPSPGVAAYA